MTFQNAVQSLRTGKCAKTPSMRGYVKREDFTAAQAAENAALAALFPEFSATTAYSAGATVRVTSGADVALYEFNQAHAAGAWNADHVDAVASLHVVSLVENPGYTDTDSHSAYGFASYSAAGAQKWAKLVPAKPLELDAQLWGLLLASDWSVFDTASVTAAESSTRRW